MILSLQPSSGKRINMGDSPWGKTELPCSCTSYGLCILKITLSHQVFLNAFRIRMLQYSPVHSIVSHHLSEYDVNAPEVIRFE